MAPLLDVSNLTAGWGAVPALHGVSLTVEPLETVCVLGANGAGKSTLVNTIAGMLRPTAGRVVFDGADVTGVAAERLAARGLGLVRQGRSVFPYMTVEENLDMGAYLVRDAAVIDERRRAAFDLFPMLERRRRQLAGSMSGGEQKMLEIARGLMSPLRLLILDEPSLGLAPKMVDLIFERIREFTRLGLTVLLVEQNALGALRIARRGYVLELGRVRLHDTSDRLRETSEVREAYLGLGPH
ncbi:MAG: ABC transporter ATP-binding protein [Candidatus Rokubacteria bacterium]|nr:ABC transporter ATP-binding protein [Candidatus Rokubacteria bacterium]